MKSHNLAYIPALDHLRLLAALQRVQHQQRVDTDGQYRVAGFGSGQQGLGVCSKVGTRWRRVVAEPGQLQGHRH